MINEEIYKTDINKIKQIIEDILVHSNDLIAFVCKQQNHIPSDKFDKEVTNTFDKVLEYLCWASEEAEKTLSGELETGCYLTFQVDLIWDYTEICSKWSYMLDHYLEEDYKQKLHFKFDELKQEADELQLMNERLSETK